MQPRLPYQLYGFQFPLDLSEPAPASTLLQRMPLPPPSAWNASSHGLVDEFIQVFAEVSSQEDLAIFSSHSPAMYPAFFMFITLNSEDMHAFLNLFTISSNRRLSSLRSRTLLCTCWNTGTWNSVWHTAGLLNLSEWCYLWQII